MRNRHEGEPSIYDKATDLLKEHQKFHYEARIGVDQATISPKVDYPNLPIAVWWGSDLHYGSVKTNYDRLNEYFKIVLETPNFMMGDNGDSVDAFSNIFFGSGQTENPIPPQLQTLAIVTKFKEVDQAGKLAVLSYGNHNEGMSPSGYEWLETFGREFKAPIFTSGGLLHLNHGDEKYKIALSHTHWGKSQLNPGNAVRRFIQWQYPDADTAVLGHTHQSNLEHFEIAGQDKVGIVAGTLKEHRDDYAAQRGIGTRSGRSGHTVLYFPDSHRQIPFKHIEDAKQYMLSLIWQEHNKNLLPVA